LSRIIKASSKEGDLVLDAYCGCGTTLSVAQELKRRWIGIDITYQSIALILRRIEGHYGKDVASEVILNGIPKDIASAEALAMKKDDRVRKEFEKWAVLFYSNNRAIINDKKGGDKGIDGTAFFITGTNDNAKIVFQAKSGNVGRGDISKLNNDRNRERAELGIFITLENPTHGMKTEASACGSYPHKLMGKSYPRIQIVTVEEMLNGARLEIPMSEEVLKKAKLKGDEQTEIVFNDEEADDEPEQEIP
jgi:adenine specific DNA methylase Mod